MDESPSRFRWPSSPLGQAVVVLGLVAMGALAVIWWRWEGEEGSGWHEMGNVSIQLLGLVVIGAVITRPPTASSKRQLFVKLGR